MRLRRAGGACQLAAAFQDERLVWDAREQAAGMLQDLAAALLQDVSADDEAGVAAAVADSFTEGRAATAEQASGACSVGEGAALQPGRRSWVAEAKAGERLEEGLQAVSLQARQQGAGGGGGGWPGPGGAGANCAA